MDITQRKLEAAELQLELRRGECESTTLKYEEVVERLNEAEQKVKEGELLRRKLHNTILVWYLCFQGLEVLFASSYVLTNVHRSWVINFCLFVLTRSLRATFECSVELDP